MDINKIKEEPKITPKKLNKYGCRPSQDVCLEHDSPLIIFGMCEDSPEIKDWWLSKLQQRDAELVEKIEKYFKENNHDEWNSTSLINLIKSNEL